jgi:LuxR family maltose regulon positive regulatory protein
MSAAPDPQGEPLEPVILRSKIVIPLLTDEQLARPRLMAALEANGSYPVTLLVAPPGYGKSRLLAAWCRSTAATHPPAWLTLDAHDNDPVTFWTYFVHALRQAYPNRFNGILAALYRAGEHLAELVLPALLNELWGAGEETRLVLDDVHVLTNPTCLDSLRVFLEQLPPTCHLVLASRAIPPLGLARLRAHGQLRELRTRALRFTLEEALTFYNQTLDLGLTPDSVAHLHARTEGWAAGLYLAALCLRDHPDPQRFAASFTGRHRHIVDFFGVEVLERLGDADRTFLVQTAVLEQLSGPLCDALLHSSDAARRLRSFAEQNVFTVPLDDTWQWYRCHPLFRDLLLAELERHFPERVATLHQRAAAWYDDVGDAPAAMQHALAAGDERLIGDLFLAQAVRLNRLGRKATVAAWLAALPAEALATRPALALASAWAANGTWQPPADLEWRIALAAAGPDEGPYPWESRRSRRRWHWRGRCSSSTTWVPRSQPPRRRWRQPLIPARSRTCWHGRRWARRFTWRGDQLSHRPRSRRRCAPRWRRSSSPV